MEEKVLEFKRYWCDHYIHIELLLEDYEIVEFIQRYGNDIRLATDGAADYLLAQGDADVQE